MSKFQSKKLPLDDIDILASIGSDICEAVRDLIYNLKEIKNDVNLIKKELDLK